MIDGHSGRAAHPLVAATASSEDPAYVLSVDLRIMHTNSGWRSFAENNGGLDTLRRWPVGSRMDDALPAPLLDFYRNAYRSALATGERWEHEYECSSPTRYRKFRMSVYPIEALELLVVNSRIVEMPHSGPDHAHDDLYRVDGFLTMCANCRRTFNPRTACWDWVSSYVEKMRPGTSHGICPTCVEFYYPPE